MFALGNIKDEDEKVLRECIERADTEGLINLQKWVDQVAVLQHTVSPGSAKAANQLTARLSVGS